MSDLLRIEKELKEYTLDVEKKKGILTHEL